MKLLLPAILFIFCSIEIQGQDSIKAVSDSTADADTSLHLQTGNYARGIDTVTASDSVNHANAKTNTLQNAAFTDYRKLLDIPYLPFKNVPLYQIATPKKRWTKDELFYLVAGLLLFLAFIKFVFGRYFQNIFRLFFQPSFRQKQTREQLLQSNLPSLLFNLFFVFAAATYSGLLIQYFHASNYSFWMLFYYCSAVLSVIYASKYIFLWFAGWVFNVKEAADTYTFVVFLINKILGVIIMPFIVIIAFSNSEVVTVSLTISVLLITILFLYRYIVSYAPVRKAMKVSPLHFFFYISAFELIPLLLIYKVLMLYLNRSL